MSHFLFAIVSTAPSPTGRGNMLGWLKYYKLEADGETCVRFDMLPEESIPLIGDSLWFAVDDAIIAQVTITKVFLDPFADVFELWYDGATVRSIEGIQTEEPREFRIPNHLGETWLQHARKSLPPTTPAVSSGDD